MKKRVVFSIFGLLIAVIVLFSLRRFKTVQGVQLSTSGIKEGYIVQKRKATDKYCITLNVSAENIDTTLLELLTLMEGDCFFHFELQSERFLPNDEFSKKSIYYIDRVSQQLSQSIINGYSDILLHDGFVNFGIGSIDKADEIYIGPFKTFYIYATEPTNYTKKLNELGFRRRKKMKTLEDNVADESPFKTLEGLPFDRYDLIDSLTPKGLYLSEKRLVS